MIVPFIMRQRGRRSLQTRLVWLIVAIELATFAAIGAVSLFSIRASAHDQVAMSQHQALDTLATDLENALNEISRDTRLLASGPAARAFAGETIKVGADDLDETQRSLLDNFTLLMQQNSNLFLDIRYVTRSGSVWTSLHNDGGSVRADPNVYVSAFSRDATLTASLRQTPQSAVIGPVEFLHDSSGQLVEPSTPIVRFAVPVAAPGEITNITGAILIDADAQQIFDLINRYAPSDQPLGRRAMLVDDQGLILANSSAPEDTYPRRGVQSERVLLSKQSPALDALLRDQPDGAALQTGGMVFSTETIELSGSPSMPWHLLLIDDPAIVYARTDTAAILIFVLCLIAGAAAAYITRQAIQRLLQPLRNAAAAYGAGRGPLSGVPEPPANDEIGQLLQTLHHMAQRADALSSEVDKQVRRHNRNLEAAARIGREIAMLRDLDTLLDRAIHLIIDEYGFTYAHVFLLDDIGEHAVLAYSSGETGQLLMREDHRMPVGGSSMIGSVTKTGTALVVNDVARNKSVPYKFHPMMADTAAEITLPLQVGNTIIGALDIQSNQVDAFQQEDMQTFQLLADQVAVAVQNARLLRESDDRVSQIDRLNRQLTRKAWQAADQHRHEDIYHYDLFTVEPGEEAEPKPGGEMTAPIAIRGQKIGDLAAIAPGDVVFAEDDEALLRAVSERVALAIETARLFQETQASLAQTSLLYQISRALADSVLSEDILKVAVGFLTGTSIDVAFIVTLNGPKWNVRGATAEMSAGWQRGSSVEAYGGQTLMATDFPAWNLLASPTIRMISNVPGDPFCTTDERQALAGLGVQAFAVIPLRAGQRDLGAIFLGARQPHPFSESDWRIYQSFAEQASLKMEAMRLLQQTGRRARQLETSAEVSRSATRILDLNQLLPRLVDLIGESFGYDHVQIFLMDVDLRYAELRASTGEIGKQLIAMGHKLEKGSASMIGQVTASGAAQVELDTAREGVVHRFNPHLPLTRSEMAVPLIVKDVVVGALNVQSNSPDAFDEDDVAILTTLGTQISVAIDNARLFEQARSRASDMSFLFGVTTAAASAETLADALHNVAHELERSLDAVSVSIYLPDSTEGRSGLGLLRPVALAGSDQPLTELSDIDLDVLGDDSISDAIDMLTPVLIGSIDDRYVPVVTDAHSAVIVPLTLGQRLVGLIIVESARENAYDEDTLTLLRTLSGTLSAIVQNQQLLEQVQRTNEQLRTLDKLKSDFLANMSHELRTPLNSIIGFSRVILKEIDGPLTEMQDQDLTTIYNSGQHLLNLINDILDQAKINANKMELQHEPFAVKSVIDGVRSMGIGLVRDKAIDILVEMESGMPRGYGDEFRTRQILLNLVSNAAKFTREGAITIRAYTESCPDTGIPMIRIDVIDTGIGIAEKDLPLLFEAFRQVNSSLTRTVGGTGLGLPIAKSLVEMQGGSMFVHSEVGVGSTFSITIPIEDDANLVHTIEPPQEAAPQSRDLPMLHEPMMIRRQILVIEDNPDMIDQFRRVLQREGYDIFAATIPLEAEAMASGLHPTLVVMDVNFAGGQGWTILQTLKRREDTCDIPVVVVSLSGEIERAERLGAFRFVQRPFMPDTVVRAVQDAEQESRISRILIIDDEPESARLFEEILTEHGDYRVFTAHTGQEGISMVARRRPNLIVLDVRMPDMDGFDVIEELRSNPETGRIPIMVVTGDTLTPEERQRLKNLDVLTKSDITLEDNLPLIEGVKSRLAHHNGV